MRVINIILSIKWRLESSGWRKSLKWLWIFLFFNFAGCDSGAYTGANQLKNEIVTVTVELGQPIDILLNRSPLRFSKDCLAAVDKCWYELRRGGKDQSLMDVSIQQSEGGTLIKRVVGLSVVVNGAKTENVETVVITMRGLPDNSPHEENKKIVYALISDLKAAGWNKYYFPSDPRISSVELNKFDWRDNVFGVTPFSHPLFDVNNEMKLSDWLATEGFYDWYM
jgi:hypothetical protein